MQMPEPEEATGAAQKSCVYVDPSVLSEGEEGQSQTAPGVGDTVDFTATGKVSGMKDGHAEITVMSVNGQPIGKAGAEPGGDDQTEDGLRGQAATADDENNYV